MGELVTGKRQARDGPIEVSVTIQNADGKGCVSWRFTGHDLSEVIARAMTAIQREKPCPRQQEQLAFT